MKLSKRNIMLMIVLFLISAAINFSVGAGNEEAPKRIISLAPSNTEILFTLGLDEKIVGVTEFCNYPEKAKEKETIGDFFNPNIEAIIDKEPDLVVATGGIQENLAIRLEALGTNIIVIDPKTVNEVIESIELIGEITGAKEEAEKIVTDMRQDLELVQGKVEGIPEDERPLVFFEIWWDPSYFMTVGPNTLINELLQLAGGQNVAGDAVDEYPIFSLETLLDRDPEVIILAYHSTAGPKLPGERDTWQTISAVKSGRIHRVSDEDMVMQPVPRITQALKELVEFIHPGLID